MSGAQHTAKSAHGVQRTVLYTILVLLLPLLAGCHADATIRFDVRDRRTVQVTLTEIVDDELYNLALSEAVSGDPFSLQKLRREGWSVISEIDRNRNHRITIFKVIRYSELKSRDGAVPIFSNLSQSLGTMRLSHTSGLLFDQDSLSATIGPLMPVIAPSLSRLYTGIGSELLASTVSAHLELKTPGEVMATNGADLSDGAVRWNLNIQDPTPIEYRVQTINFYTVCLAAFIVLMVAIAIGLRLALGTAREQRLI